LDNYLSKDIPLIDSSIFIKYILKKFPDYKKKSEIVIDKDLEIESSKQILSTLEGIDLRENQEKMLDIVDKCLDTNSLNLIEAPT